MKALEKVLEFGGFKKDIIFLIISALGLLASMFEFSPFGFDLAWVSVVFCGVPIILEAVIGLVTEFDIKADVLVSSALIASLIIGEDFAAGEVAFIMQLGALLEEMTVAKARAGIERLVSLTPQTARRIRNSKEEIISAEDVVIGDLLRVLPGETIPVDGEVVFGQTSVNQAVMTGESMPVDKSVGDEVFSGTVNQFGAFEMKALKVGEDSSIQRMIRLVQSADADKAKIVGLADRWATWIVVIAFVSAVLTWIFSGEIIRAVTILVVFCPCALVLATPIAIMAAIGNAAKKGFLVKEGDALERLAKVSCITFDKTGTLTYGKLSVLAVCGVDGELEDVCFYGVSSEIQSEHPIGRAIVEGLKGKLKKEAKKPEKFEMIVGRGVFAVIDGKEVFAGNSEMMTERGVFISEEYFEKTKEYIDEGCNVVYVAVSQKLIGFIVLSDTLRETAKETIDSIKKEKILPVLLTGDNENSARNIAFNVGIDEFKFKCLPEDKLGFIDSSQKEGRLVCMIGDGINDAPALKKAYVGIAMGKIGSDIAIDAADIALINDEIKEIPHLIKLSKRMMTTIKCNLTFSMLLNFLAIILAITGVLNPVFGALVHNAGSVFVIINSAFLLNKKFY